MNIGYIDGNAGISGNMFLGALIDLGFPLESLKSELAKLPITIPELTCERVVKKGVSGTYFEVGHGHEHHHRHLSDIQEIIGGSALSKGVVTKALNCFQNLAEAEAKIHGVSVDEVHFHEVGAIDAIIDITGACLGLEYLGIGQLFVSPLRVGYGTVRCAHGEIPIPAPAAAELLAGLEVFIGEVAGEWTTPTGAALVKTFAKPGRIMPRFTILKLGYGAGTADREIPNLLRLVMGTAEAELGGDQQFVLETNVDDMSPEWLGYLGEMLLGHGARDYYYTPVQMKKSRPGILISVIVSAEKLREIEEVLLLHTSTFGVRAYPVTRSCLEREFLTINLDGFPVRVKIGKIGAKAVKWSPEYEDCAKVAQSTDRILSDIYDEVRLKAAKILAKED